MGFLKNIIEIVRINKEAFIRGYREEVQRRADACLAENEYDDKNNAMGNMIKDNEAVVVQPSGNGIESTQNAVARCAKCGTQLTVDAEFCINCGTRRES